MLLTLSERCAGQRRCGTGGREVGRSAGSYHCAGCDEGAIALKADEYTDGHVDWGDFRATALPRVDAGNVQAQEFALAQRHLSMACYSGMPVERYGGFEDGQENFPGAEAGVTDLLRMSVTEFALSSGNDWFMVPVRLPVGGRYTVASTQVTDTFGINASVDPIAKMGQTP